ncbi:hypothetical protein LOK49_Contig8G00006 [Camellia lanceoleosa]|nr:hypothetical protein LOK49_Contig8G00006 [Camellia lanceoleosa]
MLIEVRLLETCNHVRLSSPSSRPRWPSPSSPLPRQTIGHRSINRHLKIWRRLELFHSCDAQIRIGSPLRGRLRPLLNQLLHQALPFRGSLLPLGLKLLLQRLFLPSHPA